MWDPPDVNVRLSSLEILALVTSMKQEGRKKNISTLTSEIP